MNNECPVYRYARMVTDGEIPTCKAIIKTAQRHLRDLETANERGYYFDTKAALHTIDFFKFCRHSKGEWAGQIVKPEPWQQFIVGCIFGWKQIKDNMRRFRIAYIEVPKKNGKTTKLAIIGLYLLVADKEPGSEIYSAATKKDQAIISHSEATRMVKKSPLLSKRIKVYKNNLNIEDTASKFEPLGADADTMDGLNIHGALIDNNLSPMIEIL